MAQNPAALYPDPASRPPPYRPALVATPGASEWVSCVSSPATNRSGRTPEKGAGNLANSTAALRISLNDTVSQRPVRKFCSTGGRRQHNDDMAAASTRATSPIDAGSTRLMQRKRRRRRVASANHGSAPVLRARSLDSLRSGVEGQQIFAVAGDHF